MGPARGAMRSLRLRPPDSGAPSGLPSRFRCPPRSSAGERPRRRRVGTPSVPRQPAADPRRHRPAARQPGRDDHAGRSLDAVQPRLPQRGRPLRAVDRRRRRCCSRSAFVLARNVVKLVVERRRGLPFSRFRAEAGRGAARADHRAVGARAARRQRADSHRRRERWFSQPVADVLTLGERDRQHLLPRARSGGRRARRRGSPPRFRPQAIADAATSTRSSRAVSAPRHRRPRRHGRDLPARSRRSRRRRRRRRSSRCESPALPRGHVRASADRLAARVAAGSTDTQAHEPLDGGGELVRAGALVARRRRNAGRRRHRQRLPLRAISRGTPGASPRPTRTTASCAC